MRRGRFCAFRRVFSDCRFWEDFFGGCEWAEEVSKIPMIRDDLGEGGGGRGRGGGSGLIAPPCY